MPAFTNKYSYRRGFNFKVPAQVVGDTIEELSKHGAVTSQALLEVSRPEDAPTHNLFEWDDSVAAERYRLQQATVAINSIEITIVDESNGTAVQQAAFVNIVEKRVAKAGAFMPIEVAMSDDLMRDTMLRNAMNELKAFRKKYEQLSELTAIFDQIKKIEAAS